MLKHATWMAAKQQKGQANHPPATTQIASPTTSHASSTPRKQPCQGKSQSRSASASVPSHAMQCNAHSSHAPNSVLVAVERHPQPCPCIFLRVKPTPAALLKSSTLFRTQYRATNSLQQLTIQAREATKAALMPALLRQPASGTCI